MDTANLNQPPTIKGLVTVLAQAALKIDMDIDVMRQAGEDTRAWRVVHKELCAAIERIQRRTACLPHTLRPTDELEDHMLIAGRGRVAAAAQKSRAPKKR